MTRREWTLYLSLKHKHDTMPNKRKELAREKREKRMARKEIKQLTTELIIKIS